MTEAAVIGIDIRKTSFDMVPVDASVPRQHSTGGGSTPLCMSTMANG